MTRFFTPMPDARHPTPAAAPKPAANLSKLSVRELLCAHHGALTGVQLALDDALELLPRLEALAQELAQRAGLARHAFYPQLIEAAKRREARKRARKMARKPGARTHAR